jgi:alkyl hydroperoxide reductase subunit AhpC
VLSVESVRDELEILDVHPFAISCDNADSLHAWAVGLGSLSFPILADFWPHGEVSKAYGTLNEHGVPGRVSIVVSPEGEITYVDFVHLNAVPPIDPMLDACRRCREAS